MAAMQKVFATRSAVAKSHASPSSSVSAATSTTRSRAAWSSGFALDPMPENWSQSAVRKVEPRQAPCRVPGVDRLSHHICCFWPCRWAPAFDSILRMTNR